MADVMELIKQHEADMIGIRRHIHANPELSNEENRTTALIREKLEEYGIEIMEIGLKTGVVGFLKGGRPGKTVAIREDIDALPMSEKTGLPYASSVDGVCHSCGHDIHTTVLLFCARVLSELRDQLSGNVLFLFQPAEERGTGARQLLDCKFYEPVKPDVLVGLHVSPEYPAGSIGLKEGPANASCDTFYIKVSGKGGHGAHPENCIDPIAIICHIHTALQQLQARELEAGEIGVVTVGSLHAGTVNNAIPSEAVMKGTIRTFNGEVRDMLRKRIPEICENIAKAFRGTAEVEFASRYAIPMVCDETVASQVRDSLTQIFPPQQVRYLAKKFPGAEDFSFVADKVPTSFVVLGASIGPDAIYGQHHAKVQFNEKCLPVGAAAYAQAAAQWLENNQ